MNVWLLVNIIIVVWVLCILMKGLFVIGWVLYVLLLVGEFMVVVKLSSYDCCVMIIGICVVCKIVLLIDFRSMLVKLFWL